MISYFNLCYLNSNRFLMMFRNQFLISSRFFYKAMAIVASRMVGGLPLGFTLLPMVYGALNIAYLTHGEGAIKTLTAEELLNGYRHGLIDTLLTLGSLVQYTGIELPLLHFPDKFGLFYLQNITKGGPYEVYTGQGKSRGKQFQFKGFRNKP